MDKQMTEETERELVEFEKDLRECIVYDYGGVYYDISAKELYKKGYRQINKYNEVVSATIDRVREETSKKTAEKFAKRLKDRLHKRGELFANYQIAINEICKNIIGEGINE